VWARAPSRLGFVDQPFVHHFFGLRLLALQGLAAGQALVALDNLPPVEMSMSPPAREGGLQRLTGGEHGLSFLIETVLGRLLKRRRFHYQPSAQYGLTPKTHSQWRMGYRGGHQGHYYFQNHTHMRALYESKRGRRVFGRACLLGQDNEEEPVSCHCLA